MSSALPESALPTLPNLPEGRFSGRDEFAELIRLALSTAAAQGWREIILSDPHFGEWPLGERAVAQALNDWSKTGRKLTLVAENYDMLVRKHARFVTWRRTWAHIVECRKAVAAPADSLLSGLWSPGWVFERLDLPRCAGWSGSEVARRVALKERLAEVLLHSSPAFPASTLGL